MIGNTKMMTTGYTGYGLIQNKLVSLVSYSLSIQRNLIVSNGVYNSTQRDINEIYRNGFPVLPDFPTVELQLKIQCTKKILKDFCDIIAKNRNKNIQIGFYDQSIGFQFVSTYNFLRGMSFSVQQNEVLQLDLSFLSLNQNLSIQNQSFRLLNYIKKTQDIPFSNQQRLMPYWQFYLRDEDRHIADIIGFDFSFQQQVIPKYGLVNSSSTKAPMCRKVVFGLPKISFGLSKLMYQKNEYDIGGNFMSDRFVTTNQLNSKRFQICFRDGMYLGFTGAILQSVTPSVGALNEMSVYEQSYNIVGKLYSGNGASSYPQQESGGGSGSEIYPGTDQEEIVYPELESEVIIINNKQSVNERLYIYATDISYDGQYNIYDKLKAVENIIG